MWHSPHQIDHLELQAEMVLLDDVLSALDVHTARSVVTKCLAGPLLANRTVILVTHNVAMAGQYAQKFVHIDSDGTISSSTTASALATEHSDVLAVVKEEVETMKKEDEIVDGSLTADLKTNPQKPNGKLVVAEEVALGRVTTRASKEYIVCTLTNKRTS